MEKLKHKLSKPTSQISEVLYYLLTRKLICRRSIMFDAYILNVPARLSELRNHYNVDIDIIETKRTNKFGRRVAYANWFLTDTVHALETYKKLIK